MRLRGMMAALALLLIGATAGAALSERFAPLALEQMTPEQRRVADAIMSGPRKSLEGPFNAWLRSPDLADRLQKVGEYVRFQSSLPARLNEFAILIVAREWTAQYEWYAHLPLALKAGLKPSIAEDVKEGRRPRGMAGDEAAVYDFVTALLRQHQVSPDLYQATRSVLSEPQIVDLLGLLGYYTVVSMTLNVAEVPVPGGPPLQPLAR